MKAKAPVLLTDRRIRRSSIAETGERLLDLREHSDLRVDNRKRGENRVFARVREGVAERLLAAQAHLPNGLRLVVVEGLAAAGASIPLLRSVLSGAGGGPP